jgi:hypothetical protein
MTGSEEDELLKSCGWTADDIKLMLPMQRQAALSEALKQAEEDGRIKDGEWQSGHGATASADGKKEVAADADGDFVDDPSVLLKSEDPNRFQAPRGKQRRIYRWLVLICGVTILGGLLSYYRGWPGQQEVQPRPTCGSSAWRTSVTLDNTRPDLVSTMLQAQNDVGRASEPTCVDAVFACRSDGPYFEVRVNSPSRSIREMGPIIVDRAGESLNLSVSGMPSDDGRAIRLNQKAVVEVVASELMDSYGFKIPLRFGDGDSAVAEFASFDLFPAIRPLLLTCKMRFLRSNTEAGEQRD